MSDLIERLEAADEYFCGRDHEVFRDARDALKTMQKENIELQARIDGYHLAEGRLQARVAELECAAKFLCAVLRTRTWEDKDMNACGMKAGDSTDVHALRKLEAAIKGDTDGK